MSASAAAAAIPARPKPKNGRHWVALLQGGVPSDVANLTVKLARSYGISVKHVRRGDAPNGQAIPRDVDVAVSVSSCTSHKTEILLAKLADAAEVPLVRISHKWTFAQKALERCGWLPDQPPIVAEKRTSSPLGLLSLIPARAPVQPAPEPEPAPPAEEPGKVVAEVAAGPVEVRETPSKLVIELPKPSLGIPDTFIGCVGLIQAFMKGAGIKALMISPTDVSMEYAPQKTDPLVAALLHSVAPATVVPPATTGEKNEDGLSEPTASGI